MKIGIDVSSIVYGTGVSKYTENIVKNLVSFDGENSYILFAGTWRQRNRVKRFYSSLEGNFEGKILPIPPTVSDLLWNRLHIVPIEFFVGKTDVLHTSDWTEPTASSFKVTTVHDLSPIVHPELVHSRIVSVHKRRLDWVRRESDRIIVPSQATKNEMERLGFRPEIIRVVAEGVEKRFEKVSRPEMERVREKYMLPKSYLLAVGVNPRKNVHRIIKAFEQIKSKDISLVFVGRVEAKVPKIGQIKYLDYVPDDDMPGLYSAAEMLVYVPLYEGFGLPILQAMACGCPVVTSNVSSLPEVAGDAAELVNPLEVDDIVSGIKRAFKNGKILSKKGILRSREFSWERAAYKTLDVYNESLLKK